MRESIRVCRSLRLTWLVVLAALLVSGLLPARAITWGEYDYRVIHNPDTGAEEAEITGYRGPGAGLAPADTNVSLTIPSYMDGRPVSSIDRGAFAGCNGLTSVTIPGSVRILKTSTNVGAFERCLQLRRVAIGDGLKTIERFAFRDCSKLEEAVIPDSATTIADEVFSGDAGIKRVVLGNGITSLGIDVFSGCTGITTLEIGDGLTTVGSAFTGCTGIKHVTYGAKLNPINHDTLPAAKLETIAVRPTNPNYFVYQKDSTYLLFSKDGHTVVMYPRGIYGDCVVPSKVTTTIGNTSVIVDVAIIDGTAFSGCDRLTGVTLPVNLTTIADGGAFSGCTRLRTVAIPSKVLTIGNGAFSGCTALEGASIGNGVVSIGNSAFSGCTMLTSVVLGSSVSTIGDSVFQDCTLLAGINFPATLRSIGASAFANCASLSSVAIPAATNSIGAGTFAGCSNLQAATLSTSVIGAVADRTFSGCGKLGSIAIPATVRSIGVDAFKGCASLTSAALMKWDVLVSIGSGAFQGCGSLKSFRIPDLVTSIADDTFRDCVLLQSVTIPSGVTSIGVRAFQNCRALQSLVIPGGKIDSATRTIIGGCTSIGDDAFSKCDKLASIAFPDSVTTIGLHACFDCAELGTVAIGSGVTYIGEWAFRECPKLTAITVSPYNQYYASKDGALLDKAMEALLQYPVGRTDEHYIVPSTVTTIEWMALAGNHYLKWVTLPCDVRNIGADAFYDCVRLEKIEFVEGNLDFYNDDEGVFYSWEGFTVVQVPPAYKGTLMPGGAYDGIYTVPSYINSIDFMAFDRCTGLKAINVDAANANFSSVDGVLFNKDQTVLLRCPSGLIGEYVIPDTVTRIGARAFAGCSSLTKITLGPNVATINYEAFAECFGLTAIEVDPANTNFSFSVDGVLFDFAGTTLVRYPCGKSGFYAIPDGTTTIADEAFAGCSMLTGDPVTGILEIPASVTAIGWFAFQKCSGVSSITIHGAGVAVDIGYRAFAECRSLTDVYFEQRPAPAEDDCYYNTTNVTTTYDFGMDGWTATWCGHTARPLGGGPVFTAEDPTNGLVLIDEGVTQVFTVTAQDFYADSRIPGDNALAKVEWFVDGTLQKADTPPAPPADQTTLTSSLSIPTDFTTVQGANYKAFFIETVATDVQGNKVRRAWHLVVRNVNRAPTITGTTASGPYHSPGSVALAGDTLMLECKVTGAFDDADPEDVPLLKYVYRWYRCPKGSSMYELPAAFTHEPTSNITCTMSDGIADGEKWKCEVTAIDQLGAESAPLVSNEVLIHAPPLVTASPAHLTVTAGQTTATFQATVTQGTPAPTLQWQASANGGATWTDIPGATNAAYTFIPAPSEDGKQFRCVATNIHGTSVSSDLLLTVVPSSMPNFAVSQTAAVIGEKGEMATFGVFLTRPPASTVTLVVTSSSASVVTVDKAALTFTPANWGTPQVVTLTAVDNADHGDAKATVTVAVDKLASDVAYGTLSAKTVAVKVLDDEPLPADDYAATGTGDVVRIPLLANDLDPNGDVASLGITSISTSALGTVVNNGDGTITYTSGGMPGTDTFSYTVTNGRGSTSKATVTVTIGDYFCTGMVAGVNASEVLAPKDAGALARFDSATGTYRLVEFTKMPTLYANYYDPILDPTRKTLKNVTLAAVTTIITGTPVTKVEGEYLSLIKLYDAAKLTAHYAKGGRVKNFTGQLSATGLDLWCKTTEGGVSIDVPIKRTMVVCAPTITSVLNRDDSALVNPVHAGSIIKLRGKFFGKASPTVYLEYASAGKTMQSACTVLTPPAYTNANHVAAQSNTDHDSGDSEILVKLPATWPAGWVQGANDLVLGNGSGLATCTVTTGAEAAGNTAPVAGNDNYLVKMNSTAKLLPVLVNDTDAEADALAVMLVSKPSAGGTAILGTNGITYTPKLGFSGIETFTYTVKESNTAAHLTATATVTVTVGNNPPVAAVAPTFTVKAGSSSNLLPMASLATDADGDTLTLTVVAKPDQGGTATAGTTGITYSPKLGFIGVETFTYTVTDKKSAAVGPVTVTVNVVAAPDTTSPVLTVPGEAIIADYESSLPGNTGMATATDDITPVSKIKITYTDVKSTLTVPYVITRTWTAADLAGNKSTGTQRILVVKVANALATAETTADGIKVGTFANTSGLGGVYELLTEYVPAAGATKWSSLDHRWSFTVTAGDFVTFYARAWRLDNTDGDDFAFAYSTDGKTYHPMFTVASAMPTLYSFALPPGISGTVYVAVTDTNWDAGKASADKLYTDYLMFQTERWPAGTVPAGTASATAPADGATMVDPAAVTLAWLSDGSAPGYDVYFGTNPVPGAAEFMGSQGTTMYAPGALAYGTTYYWRVDVAGGDTGNVWSFRTKSDPALPAASVHVKSVKVERVLASGKYTGRATVTVTDDHGDPVTGVTVSGLFTGQYKEVASAVTGADGKAVITTTATLPIAPTSFGFRVNDVSGGTLPYAPDDDETDLGRY